MPSTSHAPASSSTPAAPVDDLPFYLAGLHHGFRGLIDRLRFAAGLHQQLINPGMGSIYFALCQQDDCTISQLADKLQMPNATLTGLLDRLEAGGILERQPCPADGRAFRVRLTPFGRSLERDMHQRHQKAVAILQHGLSAPEIAQLKQLLGRILANLQADEAQCRAAEKVERAKVRATRYARERRKKFGRKTLSVAK